MNLQELKVAFSTRWLVAKNLAGYVVDDECTFDFVELGETARRILKTDEGKRELARWRQAFGRSFDNLEEFDRTSRMADYDYEDWLDMVNAVTRLLVALDYRLTECAARRSSLGG